MHVFGPFEKSKFQPTLNKYPNVICLGDRKLKDLLFVYILIALNNIDEYVNISSASCVCVGIFPRFKHAPTWR